MWLLALSIGLIEFLRLRQLNDPTGADGYFYLKQIQSISEHAQFYYKDYSFAFALPALLNTLLRNPLLSFQITSCGLLALTSWITSRVIQKLFPEQSRLQIFTRLALCTSLAISTYFLDLNFVFIKTATGVFFLLVALDQYLSGRRNWSMAALILSVASHKLMLAFAGIAACLWVAGHARELRLSKAAASLAIVGALVVLAAMLVHPLFVTQIVSSINQGGSEKFAVATLTRHSREWTTLALYLLAAIIGFTTVVWPNRSMKSDVRFVIGFSSAILLLPIVYPDSLTVVDVSFRLLISALPAFIISVIGLSRDERRWIRAPAYAQIAAIVISNLAFSEPISRWDFPWSQRVPHPELVTAAVPPEALLLAPHGLEFYIAAKTPLRPRSFLVPRKGRVVYRLAYVGLYLAPGNTAIDDINAMTVAKVGEDYRVFREDDWNAINDIHHLTPLKTNMLKPKPDFVADY